jgi:hypothetical protein
MNVLQAQHLDPDSYDRFLEPWEYVDAHRRHREVGH